ncbi:tetratricopeptide repeat protein [Telmatospirillum siberiense]|uniref:Sulfotransferase n=1 Tax=Telmatospirillum siberiense TaxID=382514 RepID=A0A2N3PQ13_9PROT|nr:tetratricopeptide repeat protein [Telmatospirillum siberiense]PKU22468.1 sulfotransferase [Telmatospirillum siberiense]
MQANDADRLFATAIERHQAGDPAGAIPFYQQVVQLCPEAVAPLVNLGFAWQGLGRSDLAIAACDRALLLEPDNAAAWSGRGGACMELGRPDAAIASFVRAILADFSSTEALNNLGRALAVQGRAEEATRILRRAVVLGPDNPQPYNNLGAVLIGAGAVAEGLVACARTLTLDPVNPEGENNLGNALMELDRPEEAMAAFGRALALHPAFPEACTNLSGALIDAGRCPAAALVCARAIALSPDDARSYNNLGNALYGTGALDAAARAFGRALRLAPDDAEIHYNASAVLLKQGRLREGWVEFEWRKRTERSAFRKMPLPGPEWDGGPLAGRTLLLYAEQGLGDVLQFARYAPLIAARAGGGVLLRVYPSLVRLMSGLPGLAGVISTDDPLPPYDCHLPLMSPPYRMGTVLDDIPAPNSYLGADSRATERWRERLDAQPGLKVGIAWAGDPREHQRGAHLMDRRRSLPLSAFDEVVRIPGIRWVSLQKGAAAAQVKAAPFGSALFDPMDEISDFADTAALIAALDLVISVDTSVAHLAGALGRPVWILSRFDGCWRWLESRCDSPWYPSARLYRQPAWGDWPSVLATVASDLERLAARSSLGITLPGNKYSDDALR